MKQFFITTLFALAAHGANAQQISGFVNTEAQLKTEKQFTTAIQPQGIGNMIKTLSAKQHHLGSPGSKAVAEKVLSWMKSWGLDAKIETYKVLFPTPKNRVLEMGTYKATLKEAVINTDPSTGQADELASYNAWSADGDVTAPLVFVNYGIPADYEMLDRMGISVKGKIVIAKYGRSWRGIKPKVAQEHGAIGCIIYSDPQEDGYRRGDVYPQGAYKHETGVQRGSVMDIPIYPGDPLTPNVGATANATRLDRLKAPNLLKIPVLPISYKDAQPLLAALGGPVAPADWQGALPITYHVGPGTQTIHLKLEFNWNLVDCHNVIGTIKGSEYPDEWVIRGNHHDAWTYGANDPLSGLASLLEEARVLGEMSKTGWKPKRTMMFCAWDGEEPGLLGSTEWVEDHAAELQQKCVAYINSDANGRGYLEAGGSHALEVLMDEIAKTVTDPQTGVSVFERGKAADFVNATTVAVKKNISANKNLTLDALGSGSDYSAFLQHLGLSTLNLGFGGEDNGGEYHTNFDTYAHYSTHKDPGFAYCAALSKVAGLAALRLATSDFLPYDFSKLYKTIDGYAKDLQSATDNLREATLLENNALKNNYFLLAKNPTAPLLPPVAKKEVPFLDFSPLQNALTELEKTTTALQVTAGKLKDTPAVWANWNKKMYQAEQQLLSEKGLPRREWYRHTLYAPGFYTGYGVKTLPGVREAIEQREFVEAQEQIKVLAGAIEKFRSYLATLL
jgi:N-acetylated-alpha-linked acidic dipeptidase